MRSVGEVGSLPGTKGDIGVWWLLMPIGKSWLGAITNLELADMAATTIKGRVTGTTGDPQDLNMTQVVSMLPDFTSTTRGLVPIQAEQRPHSFVQMEPGRQPEPEPESRTGIRETSRSVEPGNLDD